MNVSWLRNIRKFRLVLLLISVLLGAGLAAWLFAGKAKPGNVILITLDTLRADHLPAYGYGGVETPYLDRFASDSVLFGNAVSHTPLTLPAHTSIMTGTYPFFHGVRNNGSFYASDAIQTAAEIYKAAGYDTAAFVSSFVLDSRFGLEQGFDVYDDDMVDGRQKHSIFEFKDRLGENTIKRVLNWIEKRIAAKAEKPFFLWVHLFDPHKEYLPPEPYFSKYADNLYDGEIAYTDSQVGRLLDKLRVEGLYEDALIFITGDHGESLGEHGELTHSIFIYNATTWIPLIVKMPGQEYAGKNVQNLVRHIDLLPTQLEILGLNGVSEGSLTGDIQGVSLLPLMEGDAADPLISYAESFLPYYYYKWSPLQSVQTGDYKYIHLPEPELYDLNKDPRELNNLYGENGELGRNFAANLKDLKKNLSQGRPTDAKRKMDAETLAKLKSLGYIHGAEELSSALPSDPPLDVLPDKDPKNLIHVQQKITNLHALIQKKQFDRAVVFAQKLLAEDPENVQVRNSLASSYLRMGDVERAISEYKKIKAIDPTFLSAYLALSNIYTKKRVNPELARRELTAAFAIAPQNPTLWVVKGDLEQERSELKKALRSYKKAREMGDQSSTLFVGLGSLYNRLDKLTEARTMLNKAVYIQNDSSEAYYNLGVVLNRMGEQEQALKNYRLAISHDDNNPLYHTNLGSVLTGLKQYGEAERAIQRALELDPNHLEAVYNLGTVYLLTGRPARAIAHLERAIAINPGLMFAYNNLALAYQSIGKLGKAFRTYQKLTQAAPSMPMPWLGMARISMERKDTSSAKKYLQAAIERGGEKIAALAKQDPLLGKLR